MDDPEEKKLRLATKEIKKLQLLHQKKPVGKGNIQFVRVQHERERPGHNERFRP